MKTYLQNLGRIEEIIFGNQLLKNINSLNYLFLIGLSIVVLGACSSGSRTVNNYYINNAPNQNVVANNDSNQVEETWSNPLSNNQNNSNNNSNQPNGTVENNVYTTNGGGIVVNNYYNRNSPNYVPVINPWWNNWGVWGHRPFYSFGFGWNNWGNCLMYDWYSPWYDFHPFYGFGWGMRPQIGMWGWYNQPLYSFYPRRLRDNAYGRFNYDYGYRFGNMSRENNRTFGERNESNGIPLGAYGSRNNASSIYGARNIAYGNQGSSRVSGNYSNSGVSNTYGSSRVRQANYVTDPVNTPNSSRNSGVYSSPRNQGSSKNEGSRIQSNPNIFDNSSRNSSGNSNGGSSRNEGTYKSPNSSNGNSSGSSRNSGGNVSPSSPASSRNSGSVSSPRPSSPSPSVAPRTTPSSPPSGGGSRNGRR